MKPVKEWMNFAKIVKMKFNQLKITSKLRDLPNLYVVYSLSTNGVMHYIGVCKMSDLFYTPDARENTLYGACFPEDCVVTIELLYTDNNASLCHFQASNLASEYKPIMNISGFVHTQNTAPITCIDTGEIFQTIEEVVRMHSVNGGALCQHLHNNPRYKTVKGKKYRRGTLEQSIFLSEDKRSRAIKNVTTGEIFTNIKSAAKKYNVTINSICNHLAGRSKMVKGNIFTYL